MYFVKKILLSNTYVLDHSGSFNMHIGKRKKKIDGVSFFGGGGLRTLRTCPQLKGVFIALPHLKVILILGSLQSLLVGIL